MNDETVLDSPETILDGTEDPLASTEETVEILEVPVMEDHPLLTTSFADYTVTEGLLLLIFVILFLGFFVNLFRR